MRNELISVVALGCFLAISVGNSSGEAETVLEALTSPGRDVRLDARFRIREERRSTVKGLMEIAGAQDVGGDEEAQDQRYLNSKHLAIVLLGELRAQEAVPLLWKNLTYRVKVRYGGTEAHSIGRKYPAAGSLAKIGKPASEYVASRLLVTEDPLRQEISVWVLRQVEGEELARHIVETWLKSRPDAQANLKGALRYLDEE